MSVEGGEHPDPGAPPSPGGSEGGADGEGSVGSDAVEIAGGSAVVMAGGIGERGLRFVLNWVLARFLDTADFGVYSFVTTMVATLTSLSALGTDGGIVFFGARYRKSGERARLKGTLLSCLLVAVVAGSIFSAGLWLLGELWTVAPDKQPAISALTIGSWSVFMGTLLGVFTGGLVAAKDMRGQAIVSQIGLPLITLIAAAGALGLGLGLDGALWSMALAYVLSAALGGMWFWRRFQPVLGDPTVGVQTETGALLRYSVPQSLARSLYQANLRIDILMLTAMATLSDVGIYKIATMVAQLGALPVMASTTMFGPVVSELVYGGQLPRLNALLRVVTRWIVIVATPVYLGLLLLPDVVLSVFKPEYAVGGRALAVLMLGQAVYVACSPSGALVTMGGYSGTNLINGLFSVVLNVALNAALIPRLGMEGAAIGSAVSIVIWSVLRVVEARWLLHCWAFDRRVVVALGIAVTVGLLAAWLGQGAGLGTRLGLTMGAVLIFLAAIALGGRTEEDELVLGRVRSRLARLRG